MTNTVLIGAGVLLSAAVLILLVQTRLRWRREAKTAALPTPPPYIQPRRQAYLDRQEDDRQFLKDNDIRLGEGDEWKEKAKYGGGRRLNHP